MCALWCNRSVSDNRASRSDGVQKRILPSRCFVMTAIDKMVKGTYIVGLIRINGE